MGLTQRYFACSGSYCLVGYKKDAALIVYKMWEVLAYGITFCRFVG